MDYNKKFQYGINMKKWCASHEEYINASLSAPCSSVQLAELLELHEKRLSWLMHERLIHLIVTFITVILVLYSMSLILFLPDTIIFSMPMFLILFVLLFFYIRHYFFLENTVQHWYIICQRLEEYQPSCEASPSSSSLI